MRIRMELKAVERLLASLSPSDLFALLGISLSLQKDQSAEISLVGLARITGLSKKTLRLSLRNLEEQRVIMRLDDGNTKRGPGGIIPVVVSGAALGWDSGKEK